MRLRTLAYLALATTVVLAVVSLATAAWAVGSAAAAQTAVEQRWQPAANAASAYLTDMVDEETGVRGYALTGDKSFLVPYQGGKSRTAADVRTLTALVAGDRDLSQALAASVSDQVAWEQEGAAPLIAARNAGGLTAAAAVASTGVGKADFDRVRGDLHRMQTLVGDRRLASRAAVDTADDRLRWVLGGDAALVLFGVIGGAVWLHRGVLNPLDALGSSLRRVAAGDLTHTVAGGGPAELMAVAEDAERMRARLLEEVDASRTAGEALVQQGTVVLEVAGQLRPGAPPSVPGVAVASRLVPAEGVLAGDWADVVELPGRRLAVVALDVTGHGAEAGMDALRLKYSVTAALRVGLTPGQALTNAAGELSDEERFATAVCAVIDPSTRRIDWANAGHPSPILHPAGKGPVELHRTGGLLDALGSPWTTATTTLRPGQSLLVFTDGLVEARNAHGQEFGTDGIRQALSRFGDFADPAAVVESVLSAATSHGRVRDDITILAVTLGM